MNMIRSLLGRRKAEIESTVIEAGQWIISEGRSTGEFIYKLNRGRVAIYAKGEMINQIIVESGEESVFLGIIATLSPNRTNIASVLAETDIEVDLISVDQMWGILHNETTQEIRDKFDIMVKAVALQNEIDAKRRQLSSLPFVKIDIPEDLRLEGQIILDEIQRLYNDVVE